LRELFFPVSQKNRLFPQGRIVFGRWADASAGEEAVVARTGNQRFEVHCHGGQIAPEAVLDSLVALGCERITWQAWVEAETPCPITAAAKVALAEASTERTAAVLWDQASGALACEIQQIIVALGAGRLEQAAERIDCMLVLAPLGLHLITPWRVALVGQTNVGKSSLANALVGYSRSIVDATPGTTRDLVSSRTVFDGWPVELVDTAGLRVSSDPLEQAGMRLAEEQAGAADLSLLVCDARQGVPDIPPAIRSNCLVVLNKCDLLAQAPSAPTAESTVYTSATEALGLDELQHAMIRRLVPVAPEPGQAVPFSQDQVTRISEARAGIARGDAALARAHMARLLGLNDRPTAGCRS
jgi:tRNA modification GTPase